MNPKTIFSSNVLDIIFYNRNKNYGAYALRKYYPERVKTSLFIMIGLAAAFSALTFLPNEYKTGNDWIIKGEIFMSKTADLPKEIEKPEVSQVHPKPTTPTQQVTSNYAVVKEKETNTLFNGIENLANGNAIDTGVFLPGINTPFPADGPGVVSSPPVTPAVVDTGLIENPDVPPTFPGGNQALRHFLEKNLLPPVETSETVMVKIKFVVDNDGHLESFAILQDGGDAFNEEVIRVLKIMPQWNPGKKGGMNIKAYCYLPVKFAPAE